MRTVETNRFRLVKPLEQLVRVVPESLQQNRHEDLSAAIDPRIEQIFVIELHVEPRAAVGNDTAGVDLLTGGAHGGGEARVVEDAGRAVELGYDYPLGAIDDEGTVLGHDRDFPEVDLLLLHVADRLFSLGFIPCHEANGHLEGGRVGHAPLEALLDVVFRMFQRVSDELQRSRVVEILDREHPVEHRLETDILALLGFDRCLQKTLERTLLDLEKVRNLDDARSRRKRLSNARRKLGNGCFSHWRSISSQEKKSEFCDANRISRLARTAGSREPPTGEVSRKDGGGYLTSTWPPAPSIFSLISFASSCATPSLIGFGAPSTSSFASLRPSPVMPRISLITWIFLSRS